MIVISIFIKSYQDMLEHNNRFYSKGLRRACYDQVRDISSEKTNLSAFIKMVNECKHQSTEAIRTTCHR